MPAPVIVRLLLARLAGPETTLNVTGRPDDAPALKENAAFAGAHTLMGRIEEKRENASAAKAHYETALKSVAQEFDRRLAVKTARERIAALKDVTAPSVASNQPEREPDREPDVDSAPAAASGPAPGCKRFLPATGTIISADCD